MDILLSENGAFLTYANLSHTFNLPDVYIIQYNSNISAISKFSISVYVERIKIEKKYAPFLQKYFDVILSNEKCTKAMYKTWHYVNINCVCLNLKNVNKKKKGHKKNNAHTHIEIYTF